MNSADRESCTTAQRFGWISSLRGMGAILVFVSHLHINCPLPVLFTIGRVGVVIFFLMAGYLSVDSRSKRNGRQYLINRFFRMYPEYWFLLLVAVIQIFACGLELNAKNIFLNLTLFNEFFGEECILGASWMMPILVCFYVLVCFIKPCFLTSTGLDVFMTAAGVMACATAALRFFTGISLPTAFFLLIMVAFAGMIMRTEEIFPSQKGSIKLFILLGFGEAVLVISTVLSYDSFIYYILAYNLGLAFFVLARACSLNISVLDRVGKIGFPLFLSFDIVYRLLISLGITEADGNMSVFACLLEFLLCILMAAFIHVFIEKRILKMGSRLESRASS